MWGPSRRARPPDPRSPRCPARLSRCQVPPGSPRARAWRYRGIPAPAEMPAPLVEDLAGPVDCIDFLPQDFQQELEHVRDLGVVAERSGRRGAAIACRRLRPCRWRRRWICACESPDSAELSKSARTSSTVCGKVSGILVVECSWRAPDALGRTNPFWTLSLAQTARHRGRLRGAAKGNAGAGPGRGERGSGAPCTRPGVSGCPCPDGPPSGAAEGGVTATQEGGRAMMGLAGRDSVIPCWRPSDGQVSVREPEEGRTVPGPGIGSLSAQVIQPQRVVRTGKR